MGTPDFAVPSLKSLLKDNRFEIVAVVTQPDKKIGRKQILTSPPVKILAEENNISVLQPSKLNKINDDIADLNPGVVVVVAYGQIIPASMLETPKYGYINVHGSLLPSYRGASCVQAPILNGDKESGVTIIQIDEGLDTGAILSQNKLQIHPEETCSKLHDKLSNLGAESLPDVLFNYIQGDIKPTPQDNSKASYVPQLKKENGRIDWNKSATKIERMVRALNPWPGVYAEFSINNQELRIKLIEVENSILEINDHKPGTFFINNNKLAIQCGKDSIIIEKIQPEGKKAMIGKDFIQGYKSIIDNS